MIMESHSGAELAREALTGCPRTDDLVLAVSELASNAVIHSASGQGGTFTIRLRTAPRWARVEIADDGPANCRATSRADSQTVAV